MTDETQKIDAAVKAIIANALRDAANTLTPMLSDRHKAKAVAPEPAPLAHEREAPLRGYADCYFSGCEGLAALSRRTKLTLFKFGCTQQGVLTRQRDLCRDRYGSTTIKGGVVVHENGWDRWEMRQNHPIDLPPGSAVEFLSRALRVRLSVPFGTFEKNVRRELRPLALHEWMKTEEGHAHFATIGIEMEEAKRFTVAMFGDEAREPDRCTEIYRLKPTKDLATVIGMLDRCSRYNATIKTRRKH